MSLFHAYVRKPMRPRRIYVVPFHDRQRPSYAFERVRWEREDTLDPEARLIPIRGLATLERWLRKRQQEAA